jgi:hypothetical protein
MASLCWDSPLLAKFNFTTEDQGTVEALITSVDAAVDTYCGRYFTLQDYDMIWRVLTNGEVHLPAYPVTQIYRVMFDRLDVLSIYSTAAIANVSTTATGFWAQYLSNGSFIPTTLAYADYPTLGALATAINGLPTFRCNLLSGYAAIPSSDLIAGQNGNAGSSAFFGVWSSFTSPQYYCDLDRGMLKIADPFGPWGLGLDPSAMKYNGGGAGVPILRDRVRITWNGGYNPYPADLQLAIAELVGYYFDGITGSQNSEILGGEYTYTIQLDCKRIPIPCRIILNQYRDHQV